MKIMISTALSTFVVVFSVASTAENGLMKAIATIDDTPKPLIGVKVNRHPLPLEHIRELHGNKTTAQAGVQSVETKRERRLAKYKVFLKKQAKRRRLGLSRPNLTVL